MMLPPVEIRTRDAAGQVAAAGQDRAVDRAGGNRRVERLAG